MHQGNNMTIRPKHAPNFNALCEHVYGQYQHRVDILGVFKYLCKWTFRFRPFLINNRFFSTVLNRTYLIYQTFTSLWRSLFLSYHFVFHLEVWRLPYTKVRVFVKFKQVEFDYKFRFLKTFKILRVAIFTLIQTIQDNPSLQAIFQKSQVSGNRITFNLKNE